MVRIPYIHHLYPKRTHPLLWSACCHSLSCDHVRSTLGPRTFLGHRHCTQARCRGLAGAWMEDLGMLALIMIVLLEKIFHFLSILTLLNCRPPLFRRGPVTSQASHSERVTCPAVLSLSLVLLAHFPSLSCLLCLCWLLLLLSESGFFSPLASRRLELSSLCRYVFYSCLFLIAFSLGEATLAPPAGDGVALARSPRVAEQSATQPPYSHQPLFPITHTYIHIHPPQKFDASRLVCPFPNLSLV